MGLKDGILAKRWDLGLEIGIWASRLGFESQGWDMGLEPGGWGGGTEEEEKENIPNWKIKLDLI